MADFNHHFNQNLSQPIFNQFFEQPMMGSCQQAPSTTTTVATMKTLREQLNTANQQAISLLSL